MRRNKPIRARKKNPSVLYTTSTFILLNTIHTYKFFGDGRVELVLSTPIDKPSVQITTEEGTKIEVNKEPVPNIKNKYGIFSYLYNLLKRGK